MDITKLDLPISAFKESIKALDAIIDNLQDKDRFGDPIPKANALGVYDIVMVKKMFKRKLENMQKQREAFGG